MASVVAKDKENAEEQPRRQPTFHEGNYEINYIAVAVLTLPILGVIIAACMGISLQWKTFLVGFFFYWFNGCLGITVGYHRLFSHRSFTASVGFQWLCAFAGAGAFEGSAKWWGRNHRIHHRYVDTEKDPYNALRGFMFSHMGWMIMKQDYSLLGKVDVSDFKYNSVIQIQHKHFFKIAMLSGVILPTVICGLGWGDWFGGYFYAALAKIVFVHHCTFFINSLAHTSLFGAVQNYSDRHSSRDSVVCALFTFGEGYHNYHHEFAQDYRNGIKWYHYDPTKLVIRAASFLGFVKNLVRTPNDIIDANFNKVLLKRAKKTMEQAQQRLDQLDIPVAAEWTWEKVQNEVAKGRKLMVVNNDVIDVMRSIPTGSGYTHSSKDIVWYSNHPGGQRILDMFVGKDATSAFSGGVYGHSCGAEAHLQHLRVATLKAATA
ncbi:putative fatty-acid desaturase [Leptomonas pyrrhocoris]|uniref:Putative fatty-acid desaturase n=1 Tax=Leptomonas pyrrhocoris TaxID=157538 RepID=A0A0M9FZJ8_LEPPY|nr:putative fatty-acid desaturase [Leptomonas pyrrhocoris]KPA79360.1 putative fatty-acid desaturase [Leptomonas pyrrhocoris]|eukprot:XP_015657799.1 putative fatty-acid desaturase [Leptomonas pyrrhocoris]